MDRCYTYRGVHIPGCWGCAVNGHWACTCAPLPAKVRHPLEDARKHLHRIESELVRLRRAIEAVADAHGQEEARRRAGEA